MKDLIRRSVAENIFRGTRQAMKPENYSGQEFFIRDNILLNAEQIIHSIPAVDAVEVVRCRECRYAHLTYDGEEAKYCDAWAELYEVNERVYLSGDFYCAHGQRREAGDA